MINSVKVKSNRRKTKILIPTPRKRLLSGNRFNFHDYFIYCNYIMSYVIIQSTPTSLQIY